MSCAPQMCLDCIFKERCLIISFDLFNIPVRYSLFTTLSANHLQTNKQPIKLLYNVEKNLTSILSCCNCDKIVSSKKDQKAVSLFNNRF